MSRSVTSSWNRRVAQRLARATGCPPLSPDEVDEALARVARALRMDPIILLGALASKPLPASLWADVLRMLGRGPEPREENWGAVSAAAEAVAAAFPGQPLSCWVVEPAQPVEVFVLASCLLLRSTALPLDVVATNRDPQLAELGRTGLVPESTLLRAPPELRVHFRHVGRCWQAVPELRAAVRFESTPPGELAGMQVPPSAGGYHLVVSRGQFARLGKQAARRLAVRLSRSLGADGFLLLSPGDHDEGLFSHLEQVVAPGVLLYRKSDDLSARGRAAVSDFAAMVAAVEAEPSAWQPRWELARFLLREGYAESATCHLRELARWRPESADVWQSLAQAYTLSGDTASAETARTRALLASAAPAQGKLLM